MNEPSSLHRQPTRLSPEEMAFWESVYVAVMRTGAAQTAKGWADQAVRERRRVFSGGL